MKAVRFHQFGEIDTLVYEEVPTPKAGPGEAVVQVKACALNYLDLWIRQGVPAYKIQLPHIPGSDVAGIVAEVGPGVEGISVGQRVVIAPGLSCFRCAYCLSGRDNLCDQYRIFGAGTDGGYAEFAKAPAANLIPIPDGISFEEAAAFPITFVTAWHMLITRAALKPGQDLLVLAGGSGVGSAAVQIGKLAGARVIATASTRKKLDQARQLGADLLINYAERDFSREVFKMTQGRGVDVVFEHVGPATFGKSIVSLAKNGTLVTCGATTGPTTELDLRHVFWKDLSILGARTGTRAEMETVARLVGEWKLKPIVDSVYPLSKAREAQEKMQSRDLFGKVVLTP
ncbi:zinc-binding dehydrogenase [Candidatus Manganitrophus noduliformans]|uniref:Zinc-binding dehydrogenase n=1 Tax=Candidatus Manganitrophus noduliformans TaxID=2606439 RepID=A0A7X6DM78_9BACT|nr:zinc-binding dehydrogenase [Candidatus Manganitrophus noduliformans]NKE69719.1 zinc-binding dehydrogenase [Candidatus Manganitrophus noduliformans]